MSPERLRKLYYSMLRIRLVEETVADLYPRQEMRCPVHLCIGQEAVCAGACEVLGPDDYVLSGHRSHGHYLAKGGDLKRMLAEMYGKETGCCGGKGGSMHLIDLDAGFLGAAPIVASTIPIAVGVAFGVQMKNEPRVTLCFFGEGATEEGACHEALNFASLHKLPIVFVCENNLYSVYSPMAVRQPEGREVFWLAQSHGIESHQGDGNNVADVADRVCIAVERARSGGGPSFLEFKTYRWREHCGPNYDNRLGYRTEEEFQLWRERCPVEQCRERLLGGGHATQEQLEAMSDAIRGEIIDAVRFARESAFPEESMLLENVYAA